MMLHLYNYDRPTILLRKELDHINITNPTYIDFNIINPDKSYTNAFVAKCDAEAMGNIDLEVKIYLIRNINFITGF